MTEGVNGLTRLSEEGSYTILINVKLTKAMQEDTYLHKLGHINNDDFSKNSVDSIEYYAHRR